MFIFVITPIVGWSWPALLPMISAAAGALGYKHFTESPKLNDWLQGKITEELDNIRKTTLELDEVIQDVVAEELGREERIDFAKDDIILTFKKDIRGKFQIEVRAPLGYSNIQLRQRAMEFASSLIQQFVFNRLATELDRRGVQVVEEETLENGDIRLAVRKWQ